MTPRPTTVHDDLIKQSGLSTQCIIPNDEIYGNDIWLKSKLRINKNVIVLGFAWIFLFTAYQSIANLQSSLNSDQGLGTASLSLIYVSLVISSLFIPPAFIKKFGLKWTIIISQTTYTLFMAANMYPKWYTMIPAAIILGAGAAPLWTAKCTYLTEVGGYFSKLSGETSEAVVNRFFGIFFAMFQSSSIWGNLMSSMVLKPEVSNLTLTNETNLLCGAQDCPGYLKDTPTKRLQLSTVYTLCGIYLAIAIISIFITLILLDSYKRDSGSKDEKTFSLKVVTMTVRHLKNKYQLLIIPITLWSGFEQAFISADFTKSFVSCTKGPEFVGWTMICYGVCDVFGSYLFGFVVKYTGRIPIFITAALMNYTIIIVFILWTPNTDQLYLLFLLPAIWGLSDAIWQTQLNALYGVLFTDNKEAAFSNYRLWESIGFAVAYAYSSFLCVSIKLYLLLVYLTVGIICYGIIEFIENSKTRMLPKVVFINKNVKQ